MDVFVVYSGVRHPPHSKFLNLSLSRQNPTPEVSLVTPLKYLALVFAIIFGYLIWDEIPTIKTLFGAFLVIISTLIIFRREVYKKKVITPEPLND